MKVRCVFCGYEINLDHKVFDDYSGSIRCYCCRAMMELKTAQGLICSIIQSKHLGESISLLVAVPPADTDISSDMSGRESASENDPRTQT
jgi:hypothetical protein